MSARQDHPRSGARAWADLLAESVKTGGPSGVGDAPCPDAGLLAAYADQGLSDQERSQLESHFDTCESCQKTLAALGAALEVPAGESAAALPAPTVRAAPQSTPPSLAAPRRFWLWWLTPAFGAAAAALLWMALRPASTGGPALVQTAADYSGAAAAQQEARTLNAPAAASPVEPSPAAPRRDLQALGRLSKTAPAAIQGGVFDQTGGAIVGAKVAITDVARGVTRNLTTDDAGQYVAPALDAGTYIVRAEASGFSALERKEVSLEGGQDARVDLELRPGEQTQTVAVTEAAPLVQARATTAPAAAPAPQALADLPLSGRNFAQLLNFVYTYTFASPDGGASWRLGTLGHIERSTDRGQTWQPQSSGVAVDLIAGSGSSKDVAWVVGREGVILRSTDGERWERIPAPAGVSSQWAAVAAHDAMSATVVLEDLRRFSTQDGGRTWMQQP